MLHLLAAVLFLTSAFVGPAFAQDGSIPLRCETFCSKSKLRTASARLSWTDPSLQPAAAAAPAAAALTAPPQLDVTVVRNGFSTNAYASFPTADAGASPSPSPAAAAAGAPPLRAYNLRITGTLRPSIAGAAAPAELAAAPERRDTTVLIENLEPGLRYSWRLRFNTAAGQQLSAPVTCVAPICSADMRE